MFFCSKLFIRESMGYTQVSVVHSGKRESTSTLSTTEFLFIDSAKRPFYYNPPFPIRRQGNEGQIMFGGAIYPLQTSAGEYCSLVKKMAGSNGKLGSHLRAWCGARRTELVGRAEEKGGNNTQTKYVGVE